MIAVPPVRRQTTRPAFTQIEVALSAAIAGIVLSAALGLSGHATRSQVASKDLLQARLVASGLMAEILELPFKDPQGGTTFGPESGETSSPARRTLFDDVDDYHGWSSSAQTKTGTAILDASGLTTTVRVTTADPDQLADGVTGTASSNVKRIVVTVNRGSATLASFTAVVTE